MFGYIFAAAVSLHCIRGFYVQKKCLENQQLYVNKDDVRMINIVNATPALKECFKPTFWAVGTYSQLLLFLIWKVYYKLTTEFDIDVIECEDGGFVAIEEYKPKQNEQQLPTQAPIILLLHTITGSSADEAEFANYAFSRGFRPIVLSRRGHFGEKLQTAKFNIMGCTNDTSNMVKMVRNKYPGAFVGAAGISAGSGQVVSYIGLQNEIEEFPLIEAAVSLCPAYDIEEAFFLFSRDSPWMSGYLLKGLKSHFLENNLEILKNEKGFSEARKSKSVDEFMKKSIHMAGFENYDDYMLQTNPMRHIHKNKAPCLVLNAKDDTISLERNIPYDLHEKIHNFALSVTDCGSHVAFREGLFGQFCYMHRFSIDFLEQAKLYFETEKATN